jgi:hypothetical protein
LLETIGLGEESSKRLISDVWEMDRIMETEGPGPSFDDLTRREFIGTAALVSGIAGTPLMEAQAVHDAPGHTACSLTINNVRHDLTIDSRVTLLDLLREHLHLTGTKKGCDHGQCGAWTVIADGQRINSCLALAVTHDGEKITTIEGLRAWRTVASYARSFPPAGRFPVRVLHFRANMFRHSHAGRSAFGRTELCDDECI